MKLEECANEMLKRGLDDWVDAAEVASLIRSTCDAPREADVQKMSLQIVHNAVEQGLMTIGNVTKDGFQKWQLSLPEAIGKIETEWSGLGRPPSIGELFWLCNTPQGDERAKSLVRG